MMHQDYCIFDLAYCDDCGRTEAEVPLTTLRTEGLGGACICADCALAVAREMEHPALVEHERTERYLRAVSGRWVALTQALADRPPPATLAEMPAAVRALEAFLADMQRAAALPMEPM